MLKILPRLDSDELADSRRRELNIPHDVTIALGRSAVEAADNGYYVNRSGAKVDRSHYVQAACAAKVSIPLRSTRYSPPGLDGQSRILASFVMKAGPARKASEIFSASVVGNFDVGC